MYVAKFGIDVVSINESNIDLVPVNYKYHLIMLDFSLPTEEKVMKVIENNPRTNRYIIRDNIKIYNNILKRTSKKFYVMNTDHNNIISFFRKNNKCLLDLTVVPDWMLHFITNKEVFIDVLRNVEVLVMDPEMIDESYEFYDYLKTWRGNIIIK
ncbi:MAG: hypothetical protein ACOC56_01055 [Atribacterota bacterium]